MKLKAMFIFSVFLTFFLVFPINPAMAAKPIQVIQMSNGYPSGPHDNLNIHGKSNFTCDSTEGGNSVFIDEYGDSTITYVTNRKATITDLTVLDKCADEFRPAVVQLPYESRGYYVFAVIRGKPNNGNNDEKSSMILSRNLVREACNDTDPENSEFPNYTECQNATLLTLGLIVGENVYEATEKGFERFKDPDTKGKGRSEATDITDLFMWSGWVYDATIDMNGDGVIDELDVPMDYDLVENGGKGNGHIDPEEFENWRQDQVSEGLATEYLNEWIFNIADLVLTDQTLNNDGTKLFKVRFYPVESTVYTTTVISEPTP